MKKKHAAKPTTTRQQWTKQELEELRKFFKKRNVKK
jgi:hypothetical protein